MIIASVRFPDNGNQQRRDVIASNGSVVCRMTGLGTYLIILYAKKKPANGGPFAPEGIQNYSANLPTNELRRSESSQVTPSEFP